MDFKELKSLVADLECAEDCVIAVADTEQKDSGKKSIWEDSEGSFERVILLKDATGYNFSTPTRGYIPRGFYKPLILSREGVDFLIYDVKSIFIYERV